MKLAGFTTSGDTALATNLTTFNGLTAGSGTTCTASLNTTNYTTTGAAAITMSASQVADDSTFAGAGNNNNGALTITLQGNVGNAIADASNSQFTFGSPLTAPVAPNASYTNLESTAMAITGGGGCNLIGSTTTILGGTNNSGSAQTVSMAWRTQTQAERTRPFLLSDIVNVSGMALNGISGQTDPFVLQMNYDSNLLPGDEAVMASHEMIYLGWLNPTTGQWENAIDGNFGTNVGSFRLGTGLTGA